MLLNFDCHACGTQHPSRLRIGKPHLLRMVMDAFGEVMEPCPLTGRWATVRVGDLHWTADAAAQPAESAAMRRAPTPGRALLEPTLDSPSLPS